MLLSQYGTDEIIGPAGDTAGGLFYLLHIGDRKMSTIPSIRAIRLPSFQKKLMNSDT
jgi:hypothetical protein